MYPDPEHSVKYLPYDFSFFWVCAAAIFFFLSIFDILIDLKVGKSKRKPCPECGKLLANVNEHVKSVHWQVINQYIKPISIHTFLASKIFDLTFFGGSIYVSALVSHFKKRFFVLQNRWYLLYRYRYRYLVGTDTYQVPTYCTSPIQSG